MILIGSAVEVNLRFLKNEDLNDSVTNSFFRCNVKNSRTLVWEINGVGIGGFNHLEDVIAGNTSNYAYYASLLSMRNNSGLFMLDSILLVIAPTGSTIDINCASNMGYKTISNQVDPMNTENNEPIRNVTVNMQPVFLINSTIVTDGRNISTKVFLCSTINSSDLLWEANTYNMTEYLAFNSNSDIGTKNSRLANDRNTLTIQAIALGQHRDRFYSILYVTDNTFEEVRCKAGGNTVEYSVHMDSKSAITTTEKGIQVGVEGGLYMHTLN